MQHIVVIIMLTSLSPYVQAADQQGLVINDQGYFEMPGLNVLVYNNTFSEGHQGGVEIIQHENRVATNGEIRLDPTPGQWQPVAKLGEGVEKRGVSPQTLAIESRKVDKENNEITMPCSFPDERLDREGFNPLIYPDLHITCDVRVKAQGNSFTITVDMNEPIPDNWVGRVGYNLELFPGNLYGRFYYMDGQSGIFPRQAEGPARLNREGEAEPSPMAEGHTLIVAPESDQFRMTIESKGSKLQLLDGSLMHNNGWYVVRSLIPAGATKNAIQWTIAPHVIPDFKYSPVVHVSQVGYHPRQAKVAYIETDKRETTIQKAILYKVAASGDYQTVMEKEPKEWGQYLRYRYLTLDFSAITEPGIYRVKYGDFTSNPFQIDARVYKQHVWQPTLEYFLPVQMCHMRVNQKYRVWHGCCHMDDALMAPVNIRHFDGYDNIGEPSTLSPFKPLDHVPGLNAGGWHDAGDYDLRVESQAEAAMLLALAYEEFGIDHDNTFIDQENHHVEIHQPDGKPDILQQAEHGVITILNGYRQLGRLYRGIICPSLRQYVMLGDGSTMTDNKVFDDQTQKARAANLDGMWYKKVAHRYSKAFDPQMNLNEIQVYIPDLDDRLVFTSSQPGFQLRGAVGLAAAARVLKGYNDALAKECLQAAEDIWEKNKQGQGMFVEPAKISLLTELIVTTNKDAYKQQLYAMQGTIAKHFRFVGWSVARVMPLLDNPAFKEAVTQAARAYKTELDNLMGESPFGCPLRTPESLGFAQYYLHKAWPTIFTPDHLYAVVNYLLGCRPGSTTNSLVSGVGVSSPTIAYGYNRADWSYVPGGTFWSAVNLVRPDLPEDKVWPFIWQEREYIIGGACRYMFIVLAADNLLEKTQ